MSMDVSFSSRLPASPERFCLNWQSILDFLLLGGGSLFILIVILALRSPLLIMQDNVRWFLQSWGPLTFLSLALLSYPHFVLSYRFAYQQGFAFVKRHAWPLVVFPLLILCSLALCVSVWNYPVTDVPFVIFVDNALRAVGLELNWASYRGCGQLLLAALLVVQTVMAGHHFCFQAYGVAIACGQDRGYILSAKQKKLLRFNLYSLWCMNLFSGYTFFTMLNTGGFTYYPPRFPQPLCWLSCLAFALSIVLLCAWIIVPLVKEKRAFPPLNMVLPVISVWVWLQPFCQPYGYQAWVAPIAHGAQYLYFCYRVESSGFDPILGKHIQKGSRARAICMILIGAVAVIFGILAFRTIPVALDAGGIARGVLPNFFVLAAFVFITTHHYVLDAVVWGRDSRARKLLSET